MKYSLTSGECCSPKSPQVVIFPPRFPKQEPFNPNTEQKQFYVGSSPYNMDIEQGSVTTSDPYMQIGPGNSNIQSASTTELIAQESAISLETQFRPSTLDLQRNARHQKMARYDSRKRSKNSESSETSASSIDRQFIHKCSFYIIAALTVLAVIFAAISMFFVFSLKDRCDRLEKKLDSAETSIALAQQEVHTCLPCGDLAQGPFEEENEDQKKLIMKKENGVDLCCAKTASQLSIMLNLFAKRKQLEACSQGSLIKENMTASACKNSTDTVTPPTKPSGRVSAHLVAGNNQARNQEDFQPIRNWRNGLPGTHLSNINITAENSRIVIPETGIYFLYSQVGFLIYYDTDDSDKSTSQSLFHVVYRYNAIYPLDGSEELLRSVLTQCWEKTKAYGRYTSYVGASVKLNKGDQLYVKVSQIENVNKQHSMTYFGLYKVD